jgi:hypothetical protein
MEPTMEMVFAVLRERFPKELEIAVLQSKLAVIENEKQEEEEEEADG